jgi:cellulose synthase (UDP-forming)
MRALERLLLGMPANGFGDDTFAVGRPQTAWGAWWEGHPRLLRAMALTALAWMAAYVTWRIVWSWRGACPELAAPLMLSEIFGLWNLVTLTWFSWTRPQSVRPSPTRQPSADIYVCTYDEPVSVLRPTLVGCAAIRYPHTTYLLDDGRRPEMQALARELGAKYVTRWGNAHAKAGNINHALRQTTGEVVLMLDADHVPLPDVLDALVGYFDEDDVALVQTPHDFYNHDSIQHYEVGRHEQSIFYSAILPGKDRHGAAFWCGSGAVIRRTALLEIGGVAVETIAEDFHTTIKLQRAGWRTRYHDEVLIQGLAPHDLAAYLLQRDRWARGNLAVFATAESPLRARELSAAQRLSYFASLSSYLAGPMRLVALSVLAVTLWTGLLPLNATVWTLGLLWAPATVLSLCAGTALCRGYQSLADTTHFELCTAEIYTRALRCIVRPGRTTFKVTPKEGVDFGGWESVRRLRVVGLLALALSLGIVGRLLRDAGIGVLPPLHGIAVWVVPTVGLIELRRVLRTLAMVGRHRQLRSEYRMPLSAPVRITETPTPSPTSTTDRLPVPVMSGELRDISAAGLCMNLPRPLPTGTRVSVAMEIPAITGGVVPIMLSAEVVAVRSGGPNTWSIGLRTTTIDSESHRRVLEFVYVIASQRRLAGSREHRMLLPLPSLDLPRPDPRSSFGLQSAVRGSVPAGAVQ